MNKPEEENGKNKPDGSNDMAVFRLSKVYPDIKGSFTHVHLAISDIKDECIVVLDANVLLSPYELGSASIDYIESSYQSLAREGRLVIPAQAAREFQKHKVQKIALLSEKLEGIAKTCRANIFTESIRLLESDADYAAAQQLASLARSQLASAAEKLKLVKDRLKSQVGGDRISEIYRQHLTDAIVELDGNAGSEEQLLKDANLRRSLDIPPGNKDKNKKGGGYGDYLIWKTVLQVGAERQKHCIFVTAEEKNDWWVRNDGAFQPRPELIDEYRRMSGGKTLHLLPLSALLQLFSGSDAVVREVQQMEEKGREAAISIMKREELEAYKTGLAEQDRKLADLQSQLTLAEADLLTLDEELHRITAEAAAQTDENGTEMLRQTKLTHDTRSMMLNRWGLIQSEMAVIEDRRLSYARKIRDLVAELR